MGHAYIYFLRSWHSVDGGHTYLWDDEKLQRFYPKRRDELFEMMVIYLNWIMHQLSGGQSRKTCAYSDWSDTTIQGDFIR